MSQTSWTQQPIDRFFGDREQPSQEQCNAVAKSLSGASSINPVDSQGSMSYTVICNQCPGPQHELVISFREPCAILNVSMVQVAKEIHGNLVPEATSHGNMEGADPPLVIYSMPYLRGSSYIEVLPFQVGMDAVEEARQRVFVKHLAGYFARCWSKPLSADHQLKLNPQEEIRKRLARLEALSPPSTLPGSILSKLAEDLPSLFSQNYPQVLTHGDFSVTNILVDEDSFEITGIVDWSLAAVMPFGLDLDILYLSTGFMTLDGWHDYACKLVLQEIFWEEFWPLSEIEGDENRGRIRGLAEVAGKIGAILRLAFRRNPDGSPSEEVLLPESRLRQLRAWFGEESASP